MTDNDNAGWAAFRAVFGEDVNHLLCKWHVRRSWRRKFHKIILHDRELQSELYQACIVLMEEKNTNTFKSMAETFAKTYRSICKEYVDYFEQYYLNSPEKWQCASAIFHMLILTLTCMQTPFITV